MQLFFKKNLNFLLLFLFLSIPYASNAATLFSAPGEIQTKVGDTFTVSINTNSEGVAINAASLDIKYDTSFLSVQGISRSNSIFNLWTVEPTHLASAGIVKFSGGLASPGWIGASGNIIKITFVAKKEGSTKLQLSNGLTLANDGLGTNVFKGVYGSNISIAKAAVVPPKEEEKDKEEEVVEEEPVEEPMIYEVPLIKNITDVLYEGDTLTLSGRTSANGEMQLYVQKGKGQIEITLVQADENGDFEFTYKNPVVAGYYKVWIKNISSLGVLGQSSEIQYVEVLSKTSINLFNTEITYKDLMIYGPLALIAFMCLLALLFTAYIKRRYLR